MAGAAKLIFTFDSLTPGIAKAPLKLAGALKAFTSYQADKIQDHMRNTAPWTDRTGNARQGLFAKGVNGAGENAIVMYHTVPYGIWLEVRHSGQYAVITPTLQHEGPRVMTELRALFGTMNRVAG